jgi:hypothetical protein
VSTRLRASTWALLRMARDDGMTRGGEREEGCKQTIKAPLATGNGNTSLGEREDCLVHGAWGGDGETSGRESQVVVVHRRVQEKPSGHRGASCSGAK